MSGWKRWDKKLEGKTCPTCNGRGKITEPRDMHRSGGIAPCPTRLFNGHGYPTCKNGKLTFSDYDKQHWNKIKV